MHLVIEYPCCAALSHIETANAHWQNRGGLMREITLADRFRYALDNAMSRGPSSLIVWLVLITLIVVVSSSLFVLIAGADPDIAPGDLVWVVLLQTLSPDSVDPKAGSAIFLGTML
ncbi:MAG: hypothetical protein ACOX87_15620, partial [Chloroflexota bacterium]